MYRVCFLLNSREKATAYQWIYFVSAVISFRIGGSCCFQNCRHNVRQITGNTAPFTFLILQIAFPRHDERGRNTSFIRTAFVFTERSIGNLCPCSSVRREHTTSRIVDFRHFPASQFSVWLGTSTVIGQEHDKRIIQFMILLQVVQQFSDIIIYTMHLRCINGHPVGYFIFFLLCQFVPLPVFPFGELCIRINNSQISHPFASCFTNFIPSFLTIDLREFLNIFFFCLQRPVRSIKCQI